MVFYHHRQDPEDPDEAPIQPALFIENFYDGIGRGSANRNPDDEENTDSDDPWPDKVIFCRLIFYSWIFNFTQNPSIESNRNPSMVLIHRVSSKASLVDCSVQLHRHQQTQRVAYSNIGQTNLLNIPIMLITAWKVKQNTIFMDMMMMMTIGQTHEEFNTSISSTKTKFLSHSNQVRYIHTI